ncbi:MAG TPA: helix-turn-helix domain-containing protein [Gammaproteobacteria bacterium]|jgi:transcriptional regulator with XRE-family HTH domain
MDMSVNRDLVRQLRLNKSWSQEQLAEEAGVSPRTVQRVESDGVASLQSCRAIAKALGVEPADLRLSPGPSDSAAEPEPNSVIGVSPGGFWFWRTTQILAISLLWLVMGVLGLMAFIVAIGGIFFWEYAEVPDLTAPQAAGGGILTAGVLILVVLGLRVACRSITRTEIVRRETSEPAVE